jgi:hypothetical protein
LKNCRDLRQRQGNFHVGLRSAILERIKDIAKHEHALFEAVAGTETADHPSDYRLLVYAKKQFIKVDNLRGDRVIVSCFIGHDGFLAPELFST